MRRGEKCNKCLPGMAGKPCRGHPGVTPTRGKTIRIARAPLVTAGSEGNNRKGAVHTHAKISGHGKQWQSSSLISKGLMPAWKISDLTASTTGRVRRKNAGPALNVHHGIPERTDDCMISGIVQIITNKRRQLSIPEPTWIRNRKNTK